MVIERIDDLQCRGYRIIQDSEVFCFGIDAVLLADFACSGVREGAAVCDLGTGTGILPLLLAAKTDCARIVGVELQPRVAELARRSVALNGEEQRIEICLADIRDFGKGAAAQLFDVVVSNPPYMKGGLVSGSESRAIARHELYCDFEAVVAATARIIKSRGHFFLVHRPNRLPELLETLSRHHLEPKRLRLVHSYANAAANLVLLEAVKDGGSQLCIEAPLIVYKEKLQYTDELKKIYGLPQ